MQLRLPTIEPPWARKSALQKTRDEVRKVQQTIQKQVDKVDLPKIDLPTIKRGDIDAAVDETLKAADKTRKDASREAARLGKEAAKLSRKAGKRGGDLSRELAATGEENLRALAKDVGALGNEIKELRITRRKRGPNVMPGIALLAGLGGGLAAMYFFDPEQGRRRRALLRDQLAKWTRITRETAEGQAKDLRNRAMGVAHEVRSGLGGNGESAGQHEPASVAESTPYATADLAATDQAAGVETSGVASAQEELGGSWSGGVSVPEGLEDQPR